MHDRAVACSKPGKTNRDAAADGLVRSEQAFVAYKQHGKLAVFLESRDVPAVRINFGRAEPAGHHDVRQPGRVRNDFDAPRQFKFLKMFIHSILGVWLTPTNLEGPTSDENNTRPTLMTD